MMWIRMIFLPGMVGLASGLAVAGGMFALLIALGVIARFAGKTNTASWILYYEDAAALGGIFGNLYKKLYRKSVDIRSLNQYIIKKSLNLSGRTRF